MMLSIFSCASWPPLSAISYPWSRETKESFPISLYLNIKFLNFYSLLNHSAEMTQEKNSRATLTFLVPFRVILRYSQRQPQTSISLEVQPDTFKGT